MSGAAGGDDVEARLVNILRAHPYRPSAARGVERCGCGWSEVGNPGGYHAHLAAILADRLRAERAESAREALEPILALLDERDELCRAEVDDHILKHPGNKACALITTDDLRAAAHATQETNGEGA